MANKRLGTAAAELKLPTKKVKTAKKPKWQVKIGGTKAKGQVLETPEVVVETPVQDEPTLPPRLGGVGVDCCKCQPPSVSASRDFTKQYDAQYDATSCLETGEIELKADEINLTSGTSSVSART